MSADNKPLDRVHMLAVAEACRRKNWQLGTAGPCNVVSYDGDDIVGIASARRRNADHIAAWCPANALRLFDEMEQAERTAQLDLIEHLERAAVIEFKRGDQSLSRALQRIANERKRAVKP